MFDFLAQNRELKEQNMTLKADLEWNKSLYTEADGLNRSLKKVLFKKNNKIAELEKRVVDLEKQLEKKVFLLDDEGTPIKSFTLTGKLTMLKEPAEEKLEVGKWYHTTDFTKEELEALLPVGTEIVVEQKTYYEGINEEPPKTTEHCAVGEVVKGKPKQQTYIKVKDGHPYKEWFKIIEE